MSTWIYALVDPRNGITRYIGKTSKAPPRLRFLAHRSAAKRGDLLPVSRWFRGLIHRSLEPRFIILQETGEDWAHAEQHWIRAYRAAGVPLLNMTAGGEGLVGLKRSEETRARISAGQLGKVMGPPSEERRRHQSMVMEGRRKTPEHRAKIAAANRGRQRTDLQKQAISEGTKRYYARLSDEDRTRRNRKKEKVVADPQRLILMYQAGMSVARISTATGYSRTVITRVLKQQGAVLRPIGPYSREMRRNAEMSSSRFGL